MEKKGTDKTEDFGVAETPEDVAVLYSWANLHGAKYRDFSASRREYRAQLRHRAAEQVRHQALLAQAEAEEAAEAAEATARRASEAARAQPGAPSDPVIKENLRQAEEATRTAAAERVEAARRKEAAATAEASARREEREIADAQAIAGRQAASYVESDRPRSAGNLQEPPPVSGEVFDPCTAHEPEPPASFTPPAPYPAVVESHGVWFDSSSSQRMPQGHHPDEASGVRQIYRGPEYDVLPQDRRMLDSGRHAAPAYSFAGSQPPRERRAAPEPVSSSHPDSAAGTENHPGYSVSGEPGSGSTGSSGGRPSFPAAPLLPPTEPAMPQGARAEAPARTVSSTPPPSGSRERAVFAPFWEGPRPGAERAMPYGSGYAPPAEPSPGSAPSGYLPYSQTAAEASSTSRAVSPFSQPPVTRGRRAQDDPRFQRSTSFPEPSRSAAPTGSQYAAAQESLTGKPGQNSAPGAMGSSSGASYNGNPAGPAWLYAPASSQILQQPLAPPRQQASVAETLQHSRERVAARWFALKGVFEQSGSEVVEAAPTRQKEIRTPVLAVFSLAGGVGKTSLVATLGRSLSSLGEKVLLTDTTSHGLLPFYFGASELRQGIVRTFSPPSGSTDAPIYLVSYEVGQEKDESDREKLAEEIVDSSRGTHRILLDLSIGSAWLIRNLARMSPTVLVPLAPDMNSVISLQAIEKFFQGMVDADGRPLQPYYLINQFDVSLPLHLDVREVLRRQLGDRLLPFVIHRAPEVSEALAEGMTVVDYGPESAVAGDYMNVVTWLRTVAAPATAGYRNVRWSER